MFVSLRASRHCLNAGSLRRLPSIRSASHHIHSHAEESIRSTGYYRTHRWAVPFLTTIAATALASSCYWKEKDGDVDRLGNWQERWFLGETGWHRKNTNPILLENYEKWLGQRPDARILVPLCGKSVDMVYLAKKGHPVVGIEGVETALWELQRDSWLKFSQDKQKAGAGRSFIPADKFMGQKKGYYFTTSELGLGYHSDPFKSYTEARLPLTIVLADFFTMNPQSIGTFDAVWDKGSLVAIPPEARGEYVRVIDNLLLPGGRILLTTREHATGTGPPFTINKQEVERLYSPLGYTIQQLNHDDVKKETTEGPLVSSSTVYLNTFLITKKSKGRGLWGWTKWLKFRPKADQ